MTRSPDPARKMAPHRQRRITILIAAFALQIPALIVLMLLGISPDQSVYVCLIPLAALALTTLMRRRHP